MRLMKRILQTVLFAAMLIGPVSASAKGGVRTEWGIVAGVGYPWGKIHTEGIDTKITTQLNYTAGMHIGIRFGKHFALQPEILYTYSTLKLDESSAQFSTKVKAHLLQVPVLASLRLGAFRIQAGPVITLMDNPTYADRNGEKTFFGHLYPTLTYTAGVGLCLLDHLLIDVRYQGVFNPSVHFISAEAATGGREFQSSMQNVQLKVGFLF